MNGYDFGTGADEVIEPSQGYPRLQWFHRRNYVDAAGKAKGLTVGWHSQQGKWEEWDVACAIAGLRIIHLKQGGEVVPYWHLGSNVENEDEWGSASPFILAKGCYSEQEMGNGSRGFNGKRAGIAYGWAVRESGVPRKVLKFRAMLPEIFDRPVIFVAGGRAQVDQMLAVLGKDGHYRVLRANNARLEKQDIKTKTPYWGFRLTLKPGEDVVIKGKDGSFDATKIVTDIPREITDEFLASHHVGGYRQLVQDEIRASNYSIEWSLQTSQEIYGGNGADEEAESSAPMAETYDHPFDDSPSIGPDGEYTSMPVEFRDPGQGKPTAKPQPSNSLKPLSDAELEKIQGGTANVAQRRALQRLGNLLLAQKAGLTKEEAGKAIQVAQSKR
jgi:hypothetical protein